MPDAHALQSIPAAFPDRRGPEIARGVCRLLRDLGYGAVTEFVLATGRRVDAIGIDGRGHVVVVEVKSSEADFRADAKWPEYRSWCDAFYFAVPTDFPRALLPEDCGLIVADGWGGAILRDAPVHPLPGARRKAVLLRFALAASGRLQTLLDPAGSAAG